MEQYKPPSSKLHFQSNKTYHVFLSFRGPDVRKTLVDHLFQALSTAGLNVFLDSEKLEKGEIIWETLERAIESSAIRIPIFSTGYADSTWCLREAAEMLKSPGLIIPLFYHVDPTHVRYPLNDSSPYRQAFLKCYRHSGEYPREEIEWWKRALQQICPYLNLYSRSVRYSREVVDEWKDALQQICSLSGWSIDTTEGCEAQLVKMVLNDLIKTLDRVPLEVAKHPVGMDTLKNAIVQKLNLDSENEVVKVGIWGIGGIGKTTVAKAVYNQIYTNFEAASFISNIRATAAEPRDLRKLQNKILKDLANYDKKVGSVDEGISLFRDRLGRKRVLLILDDVDAVEQLNALVGNWFCSGSRVIITSRDKQILNVAGVSSECIHEICGLETDEGLQLFSWHTFLRADPSPGFEDLSKRIVEACKGHPLSLEVIGSHLYRQNDTACWKEALDNITLHQEIHQRLYISYKALSDEEKEIFLDIACFFIGEAKARPIIFWKSLYKMVNTALYNLSMKSLIKIDEKGIFDMHDHLRDMGRSITEKEKKHTRLWEASHLSIISSNVNCSRLRIDGGNPQRLEMLYRPGLRYLHLQNLSIEGMTNDTLAMLPPDLIWLRMEDCRLDIGINGAIEKLHHSRSVGTIWQLKTMQLQSCPGVNNIAISSLFSLPTMKLHHLNLGGCISLNNLPNIIGNLSQLQHLNLGGCGSLNNLPDTIGNLSQLQYLYLGACGSLNNLPDTIGNLSQLKHLELAQCGNLNYLPETIGYMSQLQHLDLGGCGSLNNLPDTIGNLSQLQHLNLGGCRSLNIIPATIGNLSQLQHLNLGSCDSLNNVPDTIGKLSQLQHLKLGFCGSLNKLPDTIGNLSQLQHLELSQCTRLNNLPDTIGKLLQLQHLDLHRCVSLTNLPDTFGNLLNLQYLNMFQCMSLQKLPDTIGNLSQLQDLNLKFCKSLNSLPDTFGNLQVQRLDLMCCGSLSNLPDTFGNLSKLQHLDLTGCGGLRNLPETFGKLTQLQHLYTGGCSFNLPDTIDRCRIRI